MSIIAFIPDNEEEIEQFVEGIKKESEKVHLVVDMNKRDSPVVNSLDEPVIFVNTIPDDISLHKIRLCLSETSEQILDITHSSAAYAFRLNEICKNRNLKVRYIGEFLPTYVQTLELPGIDTRSRIIAYLSTKGDSTPKNVTEGIIDKPSVNDYNKVRVALNRLSKDASSGVDHHGKWYRLKM